jgi:hypothetical protein
LPGQEGVLNQDSCNGLTRIQVFTIDAARAAVDCSGHNLRIPKADPRLIFDSKRIADLSDGDMGMHQYPKSSMMAPASAFESGFASFRVAAT